MTEIIARDSVRMAAGPQVVEAVHMQFERLWGVAAFVPSLDRMAFETAVVEATTNGVQHAVAASCGVVEIGVDITVQPELLEARVIEYGAADPRSGSQALPGARGRASGRQGSDGKESHRQESDWEESGQQEPNWEESGRGLDLIRALVTTLSFQRDGSANVWTLCRSTSA